MNTLLLSRHAAIRMHQRSIPPLVADLLDRYGVRQPAGRGAEVVYMNKKARRHICQDLGRAAVVALQPLLSVYLIESDGGQVITAGWRRKRVRRDCKARHGR